MKKIQLFLLQIIIITLETEFIKVDEEEESIISILKIKRQKDLNSLNSRILSELKKGLKYLRLIKKICFDNTIARKKYFVSGKNITEINNKKERLRIFKKR